MTTVQFLYRYGSVLILQHHQVGSYSFSADKHACYHCYVCAFAIDISLFPPGTVLDFSPQSICVEINNPDPNFNAIYNCVVHRCVQIEGTELVAFSLSFNGKALILHVAIHKLLTKAS